MGKGGGMVAPPNYTPNTDSTTQQFQMALDSYKSQTDLALQSNESSFKQQLQSLQASNDQYLSSLPTILGTDAADMDWEKQAAELKKKMESQYEADEAKKKSRTATILTSPLLDYQDPITANSILTGK
jgi:outer membrane biogenesis lipoprotein LolB